ncbi:M36 family metallopeptidase [Marininema halotolerans]|uniref:Zn-dependent metalloprotease n=1 Tax=Marininema halotolerans TaxID=1155944 RepID=A0A1I6RKM9_9BACL|nr:M36 family metallopeptidase [Marininema halotolerans]SFS65028.1 Zn-dependent metalloprotease [Marininema halotolerans]
MLRKKGMQLALITSVFSMLALTVVTPDIAAAKERTNHSTITSATAKKAADNYLKKHTKKYKLKKNISDLKYIRTIQTKTATFVRYQESIDGHPVFGKEVTVTINKKGKVELVVSGYVPYKKVKTIKKKLALKTVESKALKRIGAKSNDTFAPTAKSYGYTIQDGQAIPVYRVVSHTKKPYGTWETMVQADTGTVLKKKNLNQQATGVGKVFRPNPLESYGATSSFADNNDADSSALTNQLKSVYLYNLYGTGYLKGSYVSISSKAGTYSSSNTFNYTRSQDSFEDVMVYYHIDAMQRYIQSLGFKNINNRSIVANINVDDEDNSVYSQGTKQLYFGSGGVDDAEDAGIITHEYGHSIQDNQVPGFGYSSQAAAMGEGFGDFLGATYEDSLAPSSYGKACIGEWDAVAYSSASTPCLRRLDNDKVYPNDLVGEPHEDGEIWSQALYDMSNYLGRDTATTIILQSHWSLTPNASFRDGAKAIVAADKSIYGGSHSSTIQSIFAQRGISTQ